MDVDWDEGEECLYSLNLNGVSWGNCVNFCSHHGSCSEKTGETGGGGGESWNCECETGFIGTECEEYSESVTLNTTMTGFVGESDWNYFHISVGDGVLDGGINIVMVVVDNQPGGYMNGDCDLFVQENSKPTQFKYDDSLFSLVGPHHEITISKPRGKDWFIGVLGWSDCEYQLIVECGCPHDHSACVLSSGDGSGFGGCLCDEGWGGSECSDPMTAISQNVVISGLEFRWEDWRYFSVVVNNLRDFSLMLKMSRTNNLRVGVTFGELPRYPDPDSSDAFPYSDRVESGRTAKISFALAEEDSFTGTVYIGVSCDRSVSGEMVVWVQDASSSL